MGNWASSKKRALMHRRGTESVRGNPPIMRPLVARKPRKVILTKDEMRGEAVRAFMEWRAKRATDKD
jgi:hypothetical protein